MEQITNESAMAATSKIVPSSISSRGMMTSCGGFHQYWSSESVPIPWPYGRRSSSLSLYDSPRLVRDSFETDSLPSSPLPFVSIEDSRRRDSLWGDTDCTRDFIGSLCSSASSGYCSESSEADSSSDASSVFSSFSFSRRVSSSDSQTRETEIIPISPEPSAAARFRDSSIGGGSSPCPTAEGDRGLPDNSDSCFCVPFSTSASPKFLTAAPLSGISSSLESSKSSSEERVTSKLTTVSVPSKRSSSESSSSSSGDLTTCEDAPRLRVKDDEGFIRRAACVCVNEDESKVVLISSKNEGGGWLVPGGGLESGEEEAEAAVREAWEEAGITGSVKRCLGVFQSEDEATHKKKRTAVYVLAVGEQHSVFPEMRLGRAREWFPIDTAIHHLSQCKPHQIAYLKAL